MARESDTPKEQSEIKISSSVFESAGELTKLRTTFPTSGSLFASVSIASPEPISKGSVFFLRDFSTPSLLVEQSLKRADFKVTPTQDPDLVISACEAGKADIVVIDHSLPLRDRLFIVKVAREKHPQLPVILIFKPGGEKEALEAQTEVNAECVLRDQEGAYLFKIPDIADKCIKSRGQPLSIQRPTPAVARDDITDRVDLTSLAEGMKGTIGQSQKPSLVVLAGPDVGAVAYLEGSLFIIGRDRTCQMHLKDESVSRFHASIQADSHGGMVLRDLNSTNGTYIGGERIEAEKLKEGDKILLGQNTLIRFQKQDAIDESYYDELYYSSTRDGLTGIYNRQSCLEKIMADLSYAKRHRLPVSLIMFDLDHFKRVNDIHGHLTGDLVLSEIARVVSSTVRAEDIFGRYGGEEFIVFALDTNLAGAQVFAERIRSKVSQHRIIAKDGTKETVPITISLGIATTSSHRCYTIDQLFSTADKNLYKAKKEGRNRIVSSELAE